MLFQLRVSESPSSMSTKLQAEVGRPEVQHNSKLRPQLP